jgi:hypothetical protein
METTFRVCVLVWVLLPSHSPALPARPRSAPIGTCFSGPSLTFVSGSRKKYHFDLGGRFTVLVFLFYLFFVTKANVTLRLFCIETHFVYKKPATQVLGVAELKQPGGVAPVVDVEPVSISEKIGVALHGVVWHGVATTDCFIQKEPPSFAEVGN